MAQFSNTLTPTTRNMENSATNNQHLVAGQPYRDFATVSELDLKQSSHAAHKRPEHFPVKLHYVLSEMENDNLQQVASWQPHGRCFLVHDKQCFTQNILPLWFRQSKFASFQRQLNIYGFSRITSGPDKGGYYHECFLRGKEFLAAQINLVKLKGTGPRKPTQPNSCPDLYALPFLPVRVKSEPKKRVPSPPKQIRQRQSNDTREAPQPLPVQSRALAPTKSMDEQDETLRQKQETVYSAIIQQHRMMLQAEELARDLQSVFQSTIVGGTLTPSQQRELITLLHRAHIAE